MSAPYLTVFKKVLAAELKADPAFGDFTGGRVFLNRYDPFEERELMSAGLFVLSEERVDSDLARAPDVRRVSVQLEILADAEADPWEEHLDMAADLAEALILGSLAPLAEGLEAEGLPDTLVEMRWLATETGYVVEAERVLAARLLSFWLEYEKAGPPDELPDFRTAATKWAARAGGREVPEADNLVEFEE